MILKVFDVAQGSSNFIISPTGKTELVDLGARSDWSPLNHIYTNYIKGSNRIDRLVQTHHHGDHLDDVYNLTQSRMPKCVLRRLLNGRYEEACKESNSSEGQKKAEHFDRLFSSYTGDVSPSNTSSSVWGIERQSWSLSVDGADKATKTWNAMANCCSYVTLYNHNGTKFLLCGDMEKEGMSVLLSQNTGMVSAVYGVNVLIAPHHGHSSGFSTELMAAIGKPNIVIASCMSGDENVDSRYSDPTYVKGVRFDDGTDKRLLTTRSHGAITVVSSGVGGFHITIHNR
jgi:beta-lactamase superfamily II metal-dependent hydrolase